MGEDDRIIRRGPFKGKKIELASTVGISLFEAIANEFMLRVFGYEAGDYLITDEFSLHDFTGVGDMELSDIQAKIRDVYGLDVSDLPAGILLDIFVRINERQAKQPNDATSRAGRSEAVVSVGGAARG
jgi:hypothetical protein